MCILFRAPALKLTMARLKSLLISDVSSVCRVTGPPVNRGVFTGSAGIASGLSTFIRVASFRILMFQPLTVVRTVPDVLERLKLLERLELMNFYNLAFPYPVAGK